MFEGMSDDQVALVGCVTALFVCGTMMSLSYYLGRMLGRHRPASPRRQELRVPAASAAASKVVAEAEARHKAA